MKVLAQHFDRNPGHAELGGNPAALWEYVAKIAEHLASTSTTTERP